MMDALPAFGEAYYLVEWAIRLAMLLVVPFRRPPAAAMSWLLLIFFLPLPGLLLYLAIGRPRFPRWRKERFKRLRPFIADLAERLRTEAPPPFQGQALAGRPDGPAGGRPVLANVIEETAALSARLGDFPATGGNGIELLDDYDGLVDRLVADIDAARRSVRILIYIFADDRTGRRVIDALARAARRGVACHVLVDPVGSRPWIKGTMSALEAAGVTARRTLPFRLLRGRTRRDMRNHRKLFLIDGQVGYAGSQNIVDKDFRSGIVNRELVARVTGPVVAAMEGLFAADWYLETEQLLTPAPAVPPADGRAALQILPSGAAYPLEGFQTLLTWQVGQARKEVFIVTPYLIPNEGLLEALGTAVMRGVAVRVVVSAVADQRLVGLAEASYYDEILSRGVRIHRYRGNLLHAKNVRIDDALGIIGSSNVDIRSFRLNEEVSLLLFGKDAVDRLRAVQSGYLASSDELSRTEWRRRPLPRKLAENGARLVSPLL